MQNFLTSLVGRGQYGFRSVLGKVIIAALICRTPSLSDSKVHDITNMMLYYIHNAFFNLYLF